MNLQILLLSAAIVCFLLGSSGAAMAGDVEVDAATFFADCPQIEVRVDTKVRRGTASFAGDQECEILILDGIELTLENLTFVAYRETGLLTSLTIGGANRSVLKIKRASLVTNLNLEIVDVEEVRIERSNLVAGTNGSIAVVSRGSDVRVTGSSLAAGEDVDVVAEGGDVKVRNSTLVAVGEIFINSEGVGSETKAEGNEFFGDPVTITSEDRCISRNNNPFTPCQ